MSRLTLSDLKLGLEDLLDKRHADLTCSKAGKFYEPALKEQRRAILALPAALTGGTPLATELDALDGKHDGYGAAIYFTTEVYLRLPDAPASLVDAATRIRAAFIPALGELSAPYATEADKALERRPQLESLKKDLKLFPVAGGESLFDVAAAFLDAGESIHALLSKRADVTPGSRKGAGPLRSETIGLLNRLRADLVREVGKDAKLPRDLEARVFGYFDTLASMHLGAPPAAKPTPGAPPTGTPADPSSTK